jgi:hypothetical protein
MTEREELEALLKEMQSEGMIGLPKFTWADVIENIPPISEEEKIHHSLEALKAVRKIETLPRDERMLHDMKTIYVDVKLAMELSKYDRMAAWKGLNKPSYAELEARLMNLHSHLDFALLHLGNWVKRDKELNETIVQQIEVNEYEDFINIKKFQ